MFIIGASCLDNILSQGQFTPSFFSLFTLQKIVCTTKTQFQRFLEISFQSLAEPSMLWPTSTQPKHSHLAPRH